MNHKTYVTFGFDHRHTINDVVYDKDCVAVIYSEGPEAGRDKAFRIFGNKFCFEYPEEYFDYSSLGRHFPRGLIRVDE